MSRTVKEAVKLDLTEEEIERVVSEITERIKDMAYMNLERKIRNQLAEVLRAEHKTSDYFDISWTLHMVFGDVQQIVGRLRRR